MRAPFWNAAASPANGGPSLMTTYFSIHSRSRTTELSKPNSHNQQSFHAALRRGVTPALTPPEAGSDRGERFLEEMLYFIGAAEGIRTPDPRITNAVLYQLSYRGAPTE